MEVKVAKFLIHALQYFRTKVVDLNYMTSKKTINTFRKIDPTDETIVLD